MKVFPRMDILPIKVNNPMKWIGSLAFVGKNGFINLDVDYFNPRQQNCTADTDNGTRTGLSRQLNQDIKKQYKSVLQFRLGGEIALDKASCWIRITQQSLC